MAANKVAINGKTILDLTQDTVTADKMVSGVTAHDKSGKQITGTKKYGSGFRVTGAYASARTTVDGTTYNGEQTADMGDFYIDSASKFTPQVYIPKSKFSTVFGDATIADVLAGASFTGADGTKKVGAMPNNGAASIQLSDLTAKSVTAGYYSGGTAKIADAEAAKIIPENIKNGVTILGVEGTMEASAGGDYNIAATTNSDGTQNLAITDAAGGGSSGGGSGETGTTSLSVGTKGGKEVPLLCSWQTDSGWMYTTQFATASRFTLPNVLIGGYVVFTIDPTMVASFSGFANNGIEVIDPVGLNSAADEYKVTLIAKVTAASPSLTISVYDS